MSRETTAWHLEWLRSVDRPIYMDGRPHPSPNAAHTWAGFSTGEWVGDMLRVRVTHLKEEYLKRNGVWHSDKIELTQYLIRRGDYLTYLVIAYDPVYLSEPLVRSTEYQAQRQSTDSAVPVHRGQRSGSAERCGAALPAGHEQRHHLVFASVWHPDGCRECRSREYVSGDSREDSALDGWIRSGAAARCQQPSPEPSVRRRAPDSSSRAVRMRRTSICGGLRWVSPSRRRRHSSVSRRRSRLPAW